MNRRSFVVATAIPFVPGTIAIGYCQPTDLENEDIILAAENLSDFKKRLPQLSEELYRAITDSETRVAFLRHRRPSGVDVYSVGINLKGSTKMSRIIPVPKSTFDALTTIASSH